MSYSEKNTQATRYVAGISWPRSGHHLLARLLQLYFEEDFGYCEHYDQKIPCCREFPCNKPDKITLSKSHDHQFKLRNDIEVPTLVQYRAFATSVVSDFELHVLNGGIDSRENFEAFSVRRANYYVRFLEKWVFSVARGERLVVTYEELTSAPARVLPKVVEFVAPNLPVSAGQIDEACKRVNGERVESGVVTVLKRSGVHGQRNVTDFRYYTQEWFEQLNALTFFDVY